MRVRAEMTNRLCPDARLTISPPIPHGAQRGVGANSGVAGDAVTSHQDICCVGVGSVYCRLKRAMNQLFARSVTAMMASGIKAAAPAGLNG